MRYPAVAGRFYPADRGSLLAAIESCFRHPLGPGSVPAEGDGRRIKAVLAPHAGYAASGPVAAHSFAEILKDGLPELYVVIGPDHYGIPFDMAMCSEPYLTPLGECPTHEEVAGKMAELIPDSPGAHRLDHSVEVEIPFIQYIDPDPRVVTVILSRQDPASASRLAQAVASAVKGHDALIVASSDLCHYIPAADEKRLDSAFLEAAASCDRDAMYDEVGRNRLSVCGYGPIAAAIEATGAERGALLSHRNSWDTLRYDESAVVGYAAMRFE